MTVYVLEEGEYEQRGVVGVYHTLDAAKAAATEAQTWIHYLSPDSDYECWNSNDGDSAGIQAYYVQPEDAS